MVMFNSSEKTETVIVKYAFGAQEHHLQRAISAQQVYGDTQQLVIPTPETEEVKEKVVDTLYHDPFKQPKQYIHVQGGFAK